MGAALHLAHVRQQPVRTKKPRRTGDGGGDGYDKLVTRIWQDPRQTQDSRELLLLLAWLICRDPDRHDADGEPINTWKRADKILGETGRGSYKQQRIAELVYADRPRYETATTPDLGCEAPMIRRDGPCGAASSDWSSRVDPETGWRTAVRYCRRHADWGRQLDRAWRDGGRPEPIPNVGGLMPSYLQLKTGHAGWVRIYQDAARACRRTWEPPTVYGLKADDWPVPGAGPAPEPFRLRLAAVDGELLATT